MRSSAAILLLAFGAADLRAQARLVVDASRVEATISPLLYGQFAEFMYEGTKGGLHAELLKDRGFDQAPSAIGLPRHWERYPDDRNDDYGLAFRWDDSVAYPVSTERIEPRPVHRSLRVDAGNAVIERHGFFQPRIPVRAGVPLRGYLWLKTTGYTGRVLVALEQDRTGGTVYAEADLGTPGGEWRRHDFVLRPTASDPLARFAVLFPGAGRIWVDQASLLPDDAVLGVRADVHAAAAALQPAFVRWPGGNVAQDYHWQWGIGPRDTRPTWVNLAWRNEPEPGDFGTLELVRWSRRLGAEPSLTVNVEGRGATAEEAAAWVEYANGPATSRWGAIRAEHGAPEPLRVRFWEIGNEIWGDWVRGHSDAATYARNYRRYHEAMRAVDSSLRFIAVGDNDMAWNRTVLREVGPLVDYLAIHHYYGFDSAQRDPRNLMARPLHYERFYREVGRLARELVPGRRIRLAINEWGLALPESRVWSMDAALFGARLMNVFERSAPLVEMTAVSDLVNGWPGGIIQASRHGLFVTPTYHVNRMWATTLGRDRLRAQVSGPTFDSGSEGREVPCLDAVASRSADGSRIFLKLVNVHPTAALDTEVVLRGTRVVPDGEWEILATGDPAAWNSFATPDAIVPRTERVRAGQRFTLRVPARSASVVTLRVAGR